MRRTPSSAHVPPSASRSSVHDASDHEGGTASLSLLECAPAQRPLLDEVLEGLSAEQKFLPAKLHYDQRGSELFEQICSLDEYYLTRTELAIMQQSADELAEALGPGCLLIEPGSGASLKTKLLLDALEAAYNDAAGVTAEFNYNVLDRLQRELDVPLDREKFAFRAEWDEDAGAVVSRLWATQPHDVVLAGRQISFAEGEPIRMEESHKYTAEEFHALASAAGLSLQQTWTDAAGDFAVVQLRV
jgi:uncharacterized SAM-dependent methyltransferase